MREKAFNFISKFESPWNFDFRFGYYMERNKALMDQLFALHRMRRRPGICQFVGLVTDQDTDLVKGYIVKLPAFRVMFHILNEIWFPYIASWERRERWCRDIVRAVAEVHAPGFTVGRLGCGVDSGVCIDEEDKAVLFRFQSFYQYASKVMLLAPPEHEHLAEEKVREIGGTITSTPQSDTSSSA